MPIVCYGLDGRIYAGVIRTGSSSSRMSKWVLLKNGIKIAESDSLLILMDKVDKDISTDEALYDIKLVENEDDGTTK